MAASVLNLQARSHRSREVRDALATAVGRLLSLSKAHEQLDPVAEGDGGADARKYRGALPLAQRFNGHAPLVSLQVDGDNVELPVKRAVPVGLIVNELVTNAYKHAFSGGREGAVTVTLRRLQRLTLIVQDDGLGCPDGAASGVGSQLVELLVRQLNGSMQRTPAEPGCRVSVSFPE